MLVHVELEESGVAIERRLEAVAMPPPRDERRDVVADRGILPEGASHSPLLASSRSASALARSRAICEIRSSIASTPGQTIAPAAESSSLMSTGRLVLLPSGMRLSLPPTKIGAATPSFCRSRFSSETKLSATPL